MKTEQSEKDYPAWEMRSGYGSGLIRNLPDRFGIDKLERFRIYATIGTMAKPNRAERRKPLQEAYRLSQEAINSITTTSSAVTASVAGKSTEPSEPLRGSSVESVNPPRVVSWLATLWSWIGGRWKWPALLAIGLGMLRLRAAEYGVALGLFTLAGLAAISQIAHWKRTTGSPRLTNLIKQIGYILTVCCFAFLCIVVTNSKGEDERWFPSSNKLVRWTRGTELLEPHHTLLSLGFQGKVEIGSSGIFLSDAGSAEAVKKFLGESHLLVEQIGDRLKVSTEIRDSHGELMAKLVRNEWSTGKHPPLLDRNYTRDALEVLDTTGDVVFQIVMLPDRIRLQGKWYYSNGKRTTIMEVYRGQPSGGATIDFAVSDSDEHNPMRPFPNQKIKRMFVYPSAKHLGELVPVVILGDQ